MSARFIPNDQPMVFFTSEDEEDRQRWERTKAQIIKDGGMKVYGPDGNEVAWIPVDQIHFPDH